MLSLFFCVIVRFTFIHSISPIIPQIAEFYYIIKINSTILQFFHSLGGFLCVHIRLILLFPGISRGSVRVLAGSKCSTSMMKDKANICKHRQKQSQGDRFANSLILSRQTCPLGSHHLQSHIILSHPPHTVDPPKIPPNNHPTFQSLPVPYDLPDHTSQQAHGPDLWRR